MRKTVFAPGEYYHVCGRGLDKQILFKDKDDFARFLFLILHFQSPLQLYNVSPAVSSYLKLGRFGIGADRKNKLIETRSIELTSFTLMPNHFHLLIKNLDDGSVSVYMHRILMAYGKYFNAKYERFGHVFDGPFRSTHIESNEQLLHASAYIHKNPKELPDWNIKYDKYPHSSYQDFIGTNRWEKLLIPSIILDQFKEASKYKHFVETSTAKELKGSDFSLEL